jgi:DNA-binding LacI/PurR family transcriptional regulator/DNA-binding transcriptional regulator YhcF (GntR family)
MRYLRAAIDRGAWHAGERLPTIVELARLARVSKVSMAHAIHALAEHGLLDARRRRGTVLCPEPSQPDPPPVGTRSDEIRRDLVGRLLTGAFAPAHELPSFKELDASYGVGFCTMKRLLASLVAEGILEPHRRGYRLRGAATDASHRALVLVVGRDYDEHLVHSYARSFYYPMLYALEQECGRRNVRLDVLPFPSRIRGLGPSKDALAYYVALDGAPDKDTLDLLSRLLTFGVPVLVFRETAHRAFASLPSSRPVVFLECSNELAGAAVGRFLLSRGHRRILYVTREPNALWSQERLAGLGRALRLAGEGSAVTTLGTSPELEARLVALLRTSRATACVTCDDQLAIDHVLPLLQRRGLVPGKTISVVGFNDQIEAFERRLTTYNFNSPGLAAAVVSHALLAAAGRRARSRAPNVVLIEGHIVDRGSVHAVSRD